MEESHNPTEPSAEDHDSTYSLGKQLMVAISVLVFLFLIGFFGYTLVKKNLSEQSNQPVLGSSTNQISSVQNVSPSPQSIIQSATATPNSAVTIAPPGPNNKTCSKNGPAQKWEYLVPYVVKEGDSLQSIADSQLHDPNRVNEIIQLNGQGPYVVGSTLYLPPPFITKSSGNIKEVYGLLTAKDASYWHINYSSDPNGIGVLIPTFWFDGVTNSNSLTVGDCVKILFDDGNKVYTASLQ